MSKKVAVLLSGCGYLDGAEIREAVLTLLYLDQQGAEVSCFSLNEAQHHVVNHMGGDEVVGSRNILAESARIARGNVTDMKELKANDFDALVIPGGYGVAKNFADLAFKGAEMQAHPEFTRVAQEFHAASKPIGAICIAPAVLVGALQGTLKVPLTVTIGEDEGTAGAIEAMGGVHQKAASDEAVVDAHNKVVSCSAYMREDAIAPIAAGIAKVVREVLAMA